MMAATRKHPAVDPLLAAPRAARGAAWLDENVGHPWHSPIDLRKFQVANFGECPLAWVYGGYDVGLNRVFRLMGRPRGEYTILVDLGLDAPLGPDRDRDRYHAALQAAWVKEIAGRQGVKP